MRNNSWKLGLFVVVLAVALVLFGTACATGEKGQEKTVSQAEEEHTHGEEEHVHAEGEAAHTHGEEGEPVHGEETHTHGEEGEHKHEQEGEESGKKMAINDAYNQVREGVRLILAYHSASSSFVGSVENTTDKIIKNVRVKVHLSTGVELGPTEKIDLGPGEKSGVKLEAEGHVFEWWTTHAESDESEPLHLSN
jgi:hypothetical protein